MVREIRFEVEAALEPKADDTNRSRVFSSTSCFLAFGLSSVLVVLSRLFLVCSTMASLLNRSSRLIPTLKSAVSAKVSISMQESWKLTFTMVL